MPNKRRGKGGKKHGTNEKHKIATATSEQLVDRKNEQALNIQFTNDEQKHIDQVPVILEDSSKRNDVNCSTRMPISRDPTNITILSDATASMQIPLNSLKSSIAQTSCLVCAAIPNMSVRLGRYVDFFDNYVNDGGVIFSRLTRDINELNNFREEFLLSASRGNRTAPEAIKTALNVYLQQKDCENSILIIYTDAFPHRTFNHSDNLEDSIEQQYLDKYGMESDWVKLCRKIRNANITVVTCIIEKLSDRIVPYLFPAYSLLGHVIHVDMTAKSKERLQTDITDVTMTVLFDLLSKKQTFEKNKNAANVVYHTLPKNILDNYDLSLPINTESQIDDKMFTYKSQGEYYKIFDLNIMPKPAQVTEIEAIMNMDFRKQIRDLDPHITLQCLLSLVNPANPECVMVFVLHSVFFQIWRYANLKWKTDPKFGKFVEQINQQQKECVKKLPDDKKNIVNTMMNESYDMNFEIREIIQKHLTEQKNDDNIQCFRLRPNGRDLSEDSFRQFPRVGAGHIKIRKLLHKIVKEDVSVVSFSNNDTDASPYIPVTLRSEELFSILSHLLFPGTMLPLKGAMLMAILSRGTPDLGSLAENYLIKHKGKWIEWKPINNNNILNDVDSVKDAEMLYWSSNFFEIIRGLDNRFLTDDEIIIRDKALSVSTIRKNVNDLVECIVNRRPMTKVDRFGIEPDFQRACEKKDGGCGCHRSFTIFPGSSAICGICINREDDRVAERKPEMRFETYTVRCSVCFSFYSHSNIIDMVTHSSPDTFRCHDCDDYHHKRRIKNENNTVMTSIECNNCGIFYKSHNESFISAMKYEYACLMNSSSPRMNHPYANTATNKQNALVKLQRAIEDKKFTCAKCVFIHSYYEKPGIRCNVAISTILTENPTIQNNMHLTNFAQILDNQTSVRTIVENNLIEERKFDKNELIESNATQYLTHLNYRIQNSVDVMNKIVGCLIDGSGKGSCSMCFEDDVALNSLQPICGNFGCRMVTCKQCSQAWFGDVARGKLVEVTRVKCPYCKQSAKYSAMKRGNKKINMLRGLAPIELDKLDPRMHYGWCIKCNRLKEVMERECARDAEIILDKWTCGNCRESEILKNAEDAPLTKNCPACRAPTYLRDGCNHVTCSNYLDDKQDFCGEHWCYKCGKGGFKNDHHIDDNDNGNGNGNDNDLDDENNRNNLPGIYEHMNNEHGGYYN